MVSKPETDAELARACRKNEPAAWRRLVDRFTPMVYRLAVRMLRRPADAEDACQEVFMRVHRSIESYDGTRPLAPWVLRITYNVGLRRLERVAGQPRTAAEELIEALPVEGHDPEHGTVRGEEDALLERFLGELSAQDRALIVMRYREGLSDAEVAEATGMLVNTVKTRLHRARAQLRARLGPLVREEGV